MRKMFLTSCLRKSRSCLKTAAREGAGISLNPLRPGRMHRLRKTDGPPCLRYADLERAVDVVGDVPQVLRKAKECADLVEGADDLRSLTPTTLLDQGERHLLKLTPDRLTRYWCETPRHPKDLERQIVEQIGRGRRRFWPPLSTRRGGCRCLRHHLIHRAT